MSREEMKKLQRIKGIGAVLGQRLMAAGIDSVEKLAQAAPETLAAIRGLNPRYIPTIVEQAGVLAAEPVAEAECGAEQLAALRQTVAELHQRVKNLVDGLLARKAETLDARKKVLLDREVEKFLTRLETLENRLGVRKKRTRKGLVRVARRLEGLETAGPGKLAQGLKKARKPLKRILA